MARRLVALLTSLIYLHALTAFACETVTAQQVADALNNAQGLQSGLKSCSMAAMAMIESGGNTCAHNACCVGILQLNLGPTGLGWSQGAIDAYRNADLQTQVDGWVQTANSNTSSWVIKPFSRLTAPIRRSMATTSQAARSRPASSSEPSSATTTSNRCNRPADAAHIPMALAMRAARPFAVGANMLISRPPTRTAPSTDQRAKVGRAAPQTARHPARSFRQALGTPR